MGSLLKVRANGIAGLIKSFVTDENPPSFVRLRIVGNLALFQGIPFMSVAFFESSFETITWLQNPLSCSIKYLPSANFILNSSSASSLSLTFLVSMFSNAHSLMDIVPCSR